MLEIGEGSVHPKSVDIPVDKAMLPGSQMIDTIGQLVLTIDRNRIVRQRAEGTGCSLNDFCGHYLESFDQRGDHICVDNWLNDVEELLVTLGCTNE
jgi:hypothetical protein